MCQLLIVVVKGHEPSVRKKTDGSYTKQEASGRTEPPENFHRNLFDFDLRENTNFLNHKKKNFDEASLVYATAESLSQNVEYTTEGRY
jgi:hypothetical protein